MHWYVGTLKMSFTIRLLTGEGHLPIHRQMVNTIRHAISSGLLKPRDQLPSVRELAISLNVAPNTVARAYAELGREGLTENVAGRGTFVRELMPGQPHGRTSDAAAFDILRPALLTLSAMGLSADEIINATRKLLVEGPVVLGVVGTSARGAAKWCRILERELKDFWIATVPVVLSEFTDDREAVLEKLKDASYVFTLLTGYSTIRASLEGTAKQVLPLITDLSMNSHRALSQLPPNGRIGLVSEDIYINSVFEVLANYTNVAGITRVRENDRDGIERLLNTMDVVVYTFASGEIVEALPPTACRLLPLEYQLGQDNIKSIIEAVAVYSKPAASPAARRA